MSTINLRGASGRLYTYFIGNLDDPGLAQAAGNYAFLRRGPDGTFVPVYLGQCDNLRGRCPRHERLVDARRVGATHFAAHVTPGGELVRLAEERDLIGYWNPPLNVHHRIVG